MKRSPKMQTSEPEVKMFTEEENNEHLAKTFGIPLDVVSGNDPSPD